eukprot:scaffold133664_cov20-Tisochrysis_lutea.AAC.3
MHAMWACLLQHLCSECALLLRTSFFVLCSAAEFVLKASADPGLVSLVLRRLVHAIMPAAWVGLNLSVHLREFVPVA